MTPAKNKGEGNDWVTAINLIANEQEDQSDCIKDHGKRLFDLEKKYAVLQARLAIYISLAVGILGLVLYLAREWLKKMLLG